MADNIQSKLIALLDYLIHSGEDRKYVYLITCIHGDGHPAQYTVCDEKRDLLRVSLLKAKDKNLWKELEEDIEGSFTEAPPIFFEAQKKFGFAGQ